MAVSRMLNTSFVAMIGALASAAGASEPASFIARVEQSQGLGRSGPEVREAAASVAAARSSRGEPASFIVRVEQSQGLGRSSPEADEGAASAPAATSSAVEPASFIARVEQSQGVVGAATLVGEDELSREQVRLVQRALTDMGYPTPVNGEWDGRTRSSVMAFQRAHSLPVSGTLDSRTVDALGVDPADVAPVRSTDDKR